MTISCQITRQDVAGACAVMALKTRWFLFGLWLLLLAFSVWMNSWVVMHGSGARRVAILTPVAIGGFIFLLIAWVAPHLRARRMVLRDITWTLGDDGVHCQTSVGNADMKWEAFLRYRETSRFFMLYVQKGMAQFIPKRFLSSEQIDSLRALLASHIKNQ